MMPLALTKVLEGKQAKLSHHLAEVDKRSWLSLGTRSSEVSKRPRLLKNLMPERDRLGGDCRPR
jgi:hypothetical protein